MLHTFYRSFYAKKKLYGHTKLVIETRLELSPGRVRVKVRSSEVNFES